jgi:hypothetical protein
MKIIPLLETKSDAKTAVDKLAATLDKTDFATWKSFSQAMLGKYDGGDKEDFEEELKLAYLQHCCSEYSADLDTKYGNPLKLNFDTSDEYVDKVKEDMKEKYKLDSLGPNASLYMTDLLKEPVEAHWAKYFDQSASKLNK